MHKRTDNSKRKWSLQHGAPLVGVVVLIVLGAAITALVYAVMNRLLHAQYDSELSHAVAYVEHNADVDDLRQCVETGVSSPKRDELQTFVNTMIDDLGLSYIYIAIPEADRMVNVVSATNAAERAAGETDMPLLESTDAYSAEELQRYRLCWDAATTQFFEETSEYGRFYTACKPLRDSNGQTVALLCIDVSSEALHEELRYVTALTVLLIAVVVGLMFVVMLVFLRLKAIKPMMALVRSAKEFASASAGMTEIDNLHYNKPAIDTLELSVLSDAIDKMADNMREYVAKTIEAERRTKEIGEENIRLAEQSRAAAKISQLTDSVRSLFNNMPAMTFSKDVSTGEYLACNQLFADFVHRASPHEVVGVREQDLFDADTLRHFAETDAIVLSMDKPYVFVEDVLGPDGSHRQFQTTKIRFVDGHGRVCVLGMSSDTTELMITKQQSLEAQAAYEQARNASLTYANIARALAMDYSYLYYVDIQTDRFIEYRSDLSSEDLVLERRGEDFFAQSLQDARTRVYPADREAFFGAFTKKNILATIDKHGTFTLSYRLMLTENPTYVSMKITRMVGDGNHLVVGVNNVDAQMRMQEEIERAREEHITFSRISALSGNYICIYTVDPANGHYLEYNVTEDYEKLNLPKEGDDFFAVSRKEGEILVCEEDRARYMAAFTRENVMDEIRRNGLFAFEYRLLLAGVPTYVRLKAAIVEEVDGPQLVVGVSNIDAQIKREQEFNARLTSEHTKAYVDALTGLQNKHAYVDLEAEINRDIEAGKPLQFAVVVLDINGLKHINDTEGHRRGDALIVEAARNIAAVFVNSPIFRVGGDEFAIIAREKDYADIDRLIREIAECNTRNLANKGVVIACGMARYEGDNRVSSVFERADIGMYRNKKNLKGEDAD